MKYKINIPVRWAACALIAFIGCLTLSFGQEASTEKESISIEQVEKNPGDLKLQQDFLAHTDLSKDELTKIYNQLMQKHPDNSILPFALGEHFWQGELPEAEPLLKQASKLDPNNAKIYFYLWIDAERWGKFALGRKYLKKAVKADPKNPDYAFYYASSFRSIDQKKYVKKSLKVAKDFPENERGAQALYWLAFESKDKAKKLAYYKQLKEEYPIDKFSWSKSGMMGYYELLLEENPEKAADLAQTMVNLAKQGYMKKLWKEMQKVGKALIEVQNNLNNTPQKALDALAEIDTLNYFKRSDFLRLQEAKTLTKLGKEAIAYKKLSEAYAKEPKDDFKNALTNLGQKLGKNKKTIENDVWKIRNSFTEKATDFKLKNYLNDKMTSLADYKGKVILLTYWFPGCGPCRGEFPHFQNVVDKFSKDKLAYIGINIVADQNDYVLPFLKYSGYSFTPLEEQKHRDKGNMDNGGAAPVNFLIDKEGNIVYSNFRINGHNEKELENMINSLISKK